MAVHSTSDLLRLLATEGTPFAEVAAAVSHRFGVGEESRAWLARTLITLLRVRAAGCQRAAYRACIGAALCGVP